MHCVQSKLTYDHEPIAVRRNGKYFILVKRDNDNCYSIQFDPPLDRHFTWRNVTESKRARLHWERVCRRAHSWCVANSGYLCLEVFSILCRIYIWQLRMQRQRARTNMWIVELHTIIRYFRPSRPIMFSFRHHTIDFIIIIIANWTPEAVRLRIIQTVAQSR